MFTIFTIVYIIIFIFIKATIEFIGIIAIVLVKELSGILGLFYSDSEGIEKGEKK